MPMSLPARLVATSQIETRRLTAQPKLEGKGSPESQGRLKNEESPESRWRLKNEESPETQVERGLKKGVDI